MLPFLAATDLCLQAAHGRKPPFAIARTCLFIGCNFLVGEYQKLFRSQRSDNRFGNLAGFQDTLRSDHRQRNCIFWCGGTIRIWRD